MPNLTIRFIAGTDIVSRLIQYATNSLFCHTECLSCDGTAWIGAHSGTGVQARKLDWCKPTLERRYSVPVTPEGYERAMAWLESKVGEKYNYASIIGLALHWRIGASRSETDCSALMIGLLQLADIQPLNCLEGFNYLITPETLHLSPIFVGRGVSAATQR